MARPFDKLGLRLERLGPPKEQARRELLMVHGAGAGANQWQGLAQPLAWAGYGVNLIDLPGHGQDPWQLPAWTSLNDYVDYAGRALEALGRPVLVGWAMGGWIVARLLERADLPAVLLEPWVRGLCLGTEPARVALEMALGLPRLRPRTGRAPRLVLAGSPRAQRRLAARLGADLRPLPGHRGNMWMEDPQTRVAGLLLDFLARLEQRS